MKTTSSYRQICYDFDNHEVDFLKMFGVWGTILDNLQEHEYVTIEGYERIGPQKENDNADIGRT